MQLENLKLKVDSLAWLPPIFCYFQRNILKLKWHSGQKERCQNVKPVKIEKENKLRLRNNKKEKNLLMQMKIDDAKKKKDFTIDKCHSSG